MARTGGTGATTLDGLPRDRSPTASHMPTGRMVETRSGDLLSTLTDTRTDRTTVRTEGKTAQAHCSPGVHGEPRGAGSAALRRRSAARRRSTRRGGVGTTRAAADPLQQHGLALAVDRIAPDPAGNPERPTAVRGARPP